MADKGIRVTAVDLETGESAETVIGPGNYVILTSAPCHVAGEDHHGNGTTVLTLKGRSRQYMGTSYAVPTPTGLVMPPEVSGG